MLRVKPSAHGISCIKMTPSRIEWGLLTINPNAAAALRARTSGQQRRQSAKAAQTAMRLARALDFDADAL